MKIFNRLIGHNSEPFIIAEMSGNHNQSLENALDIVDAAASCGAHALKIQTFTADTMTLDLNESQFYIDDAKSLWNGRSLFELYEQAHTPWDWHEPIFNRARDLGMIPFSTPFDSSAVHFLEGLNVDCYKIASFENTDIPLIQLVASTGKPLIISTGLATKEELEETVYEARKAGCKDLILLKCTSTYPASPENTNILTIPYMRDLFNCEVGISDHTMGIGVAVASVALGASVVEKHFTIRRSDGGVDSAFSMEPNEMRSLVVETKRAWAALGKIYMGVTDAEKKSIIYRRSSYVVKEIKCGEFFTNDNLKSIRPGYGLPTKYIKNFINKKANRDIDKGTPLSWDMISE